ncbi:MAG TPA: LCP family protein [Candidatus Saccharimonadales bacterium]|nr:LCP family protein [Candidatus Saccharimonadales bacterium]
MQRRARKQFKESISVPLAGGAAMPYEMNRSLPNPAYVSTARPSPESAPLKIQSKRPWKKIIIRSCLSLLLLLILAGSWIGYKFIYNEVKVFGWSGIWSLIHPGPLNSQGGRVNILLAGDSVGRTDNGGGQQLTDSIMLVSIDTQKHTAFLLSIPRDLWVKIPGFGYSKINAAAEDGASDYSNNPSYDQNGMGLLEQVVSKNFGIPIDYYGLIDYAAFKDAVNAVGGITVNIQSNDPRGLYDASAAAPGNPQPLVELSNGVHTLDGQEALNLARARGDAFGSYGFAGSDFTRTQNQRMMMLAIKDKVTSAGVLSNPFKLGQLFDSFGNNVQTDLSLGNARQLYNISRGISNANIASKGLNNINGHNLLTGYLTPDGEDALIPTTGVDNYSVIQAFVAQLTDNSQ